MNRLGTDVVALVAIMGGAAVGGAVTLALSHGPEHFSYECATATVETAPRVVVSLSGGDGAVVVAPNVRVRTTESCVQVLEMPRFDRVRVDRVRVAELEAVLEQRAAALEAIELELEGRLGNGNLR